jgi:hypothetical protein
MNNSSKDNTIVSVSTSQQSSILVVSPYILILNSLGDGRVSKFIIDKGGGGNRKSICNSANDSKPGKTDMKYL